MTSKQPSTTTQINKTELPAWVDAASFDNYKTAVDLSHRPYEAYGGERIAGRNDMQEGAGATLNNGAAMANGFLGQAGAAFGSNANFGVRDVANPAGVGDVSARSFLDGNVGAYMNPNIDNVVNTTLDGMRRQGALAQQGIADQAGGVGAKGGSRFGVQSAVLEAENNRNMAGTEANLRSAAFQDAANRMQSDNQSALQAALANQSSGLTTQGQQLQAGIANQNAALGAAGIRNQAGSGLAGLGSTASDVNSRTALLQNELGGNRQAYDQSVLDQAYADYAEKQNWGVDQLNLRMAALGMSPYGSTSTSTTTQPKQSGSGLLTGLGAAASIFSLLSDKRTKKNIKKIGKVPGTDLNKYEFQYKDEYATADNEPQVGLMAQDVKKKVPSAIQHIRDHNGKKLMAVDYPAAVMGAAKPKPSFGIAAAARRAA